LWVTSPFGPYFYAAGRDITDRVQALTALREREQFQSTLFENFPNGAVSVLDEEFRYVMAAGRSLESRGISPDQLIGKTVVEAFSQGYADQVVPHFRRALNGESVQFELAIGDFFYLVSSAPLRDELTGKTNILSVSQDITERRAAEAALQRAHDEAEALVQNRTRELRYAIASLESARATAEQASQAKSEFLSRMSHELRTPLNAILGFGQVLDMQPLDEDSKDFVSHILRGGRHLLDLINEVLDITRVETGHLEISLEPVHVAEIVSEACALMAVLAAERGVTIQDETSWLPGEYVLADRQRLKQVLINLIANAIKYNRDAGQVRLASRHEGDMLAIDVSDTGPGIASDDLAKLFTPFERLNASASGIEGTGLGLALSQRLITAMDGSLGVESTPGVGSVFTLRLSRAESPSNGLTHSPDLDAPEMVPSGPARKYTVLCIEDNPSNLRLIEVILNSRPAIQLLTAIQGSVGLDLARNHQPDLILLDLNLPDMNGKEVLSRLKLSDRTQDIPVIIVSADATPHQVDRLLAGGAEAFLTKPLDVPEFLRTLDEWFGNSEVRLLRPIHFLKLRRDVLGGAWSATIRL